MNRREWRGQSFEARQETQTGCIPARECDQYATKWPAKDGFFRRPKYSIEVNSVLMKKPKH
jgi:hypothetical protein